MDMSNPPITPALISFLKDLQIVNMNEPAMLALMMYDYLLTLADEVELVWKRPFTGITLLFLINRYFAPMEMIVLTVAFQSNWPMELYARFCVNDSRVTREQDMQQLPEYANVRNLFCRTSQQVLIEEYPVIMIIRVYALFGKSRPVLVGLILVFLAQVAVQARVLVTGVALKVPILAGCILVGRTQLFTGLWIAPLVTDGCIFFLTLWRSRIYFNRAARMPMLQLFLRDGVAYFFVIFGSNLLNVIMFLAVSAEPLRPFFAPEAQAITSIMVSRIVLNIRSFSQDAVIPLASLSRSENR
ncbi:hypothetical protein PUNSTDRAFT_135020 [Punctularia strigosozonata HHB-11173 SS5]|uniref:uncharacterized protein n=1 Tax=Punctularia strigosozonata (strain HHB-11173) TaxID=741275 RepID=UPI00044168DA|nr:uncharacterized protein PUNSTDRAFT_135020 [Punctularia strigosozonata HHB-11173 SS5]EIN08642.1 hypothetical protein PUNSTDRAFT_135020 [Punctularia strigosozonata HHB-11173 SS5]